MNFPWRARRTMNRSAGPSAPTLRQQLAVESTAAGAPVPPADMKADDLVDSARAAADSGNLPVAIALLKRATEIDPKNKFAWNNLGPHLLRDARGRTRDRGISEAA